MRHRIDVALCCCVVIVAGCHQTPTEPDRREPTLVVYCQPAGRDVSCTAVLFGVTSATSSRDVTLTAVWMASDATLGSYSAPGQFTATGRGEVGLWARYEEYESWPQARFLVDPVEPARWLYSLDGFVVDDETNQGLAGAEVRILTGYAAGRTGTAGANGFYEVERVLTDETFSAVASHAGYEPVTVQYRVSPPDGSSSDPSSLNFRLHRSTGAPISSK